MIIFFHILLILGCGITTGIFLGGFWWIVFGLTVGCMEAGILCSKDNEFWGEEDNNFIIIFFPMLLGGILGGKLIGGFGPVMLGFLIGGAAGLILLLAYEKGGKIFAALLPIFVPASIVFTLLFFDRYWLTVILGAFVGFLACFLLSAPHIFWRLAKHRKKLRLEAEEKRRQEEYERNRPIEEKLAELEAVAQKAHKENSLELKKAEKEWANSTFGSNLEQVFESYIYSSERFKPFESSFSDLISDKGFYRASANVDYIRDIAVDYASRYRVAAAKAKLENDIYTINRKKALLFTERLNEIYEKLNPRQIERKIEDAAKTLNIGKLNIKIPDTVRGISNLAVQFSNDRREALWNSFGNYSKFKKETNLSDGASALVFLGGLALGGLLSKYEVNKELKLKLFKAQERIIKKIPKLEKGRTEAEAFSKRAGELNRALEGTMNAYEKMFVEIYNSLYPPYDSSKSKEARKQNKQNGGDYFSDEEAEAVSHLVFAGRFLLKLVDAKLEGENNE